MRQQNNLFKLVWFFIKFQNVILNCTPAIRGVNDTKLNICHSFKVNGIDAGPFIADVFLLPNNKKGYYLLTVGKNGEVFERKNKSQINTKRDECSKDIKTET